MKNLSKEIELDNNIQELDNSLKLLNKGIEDQLSKEEKKELIDSAKKFGITPIKQTSFGEKFIVHYDQNQNLKIYPYQSQEKLKDKLSTLALNKQQKKEYLSLIREGGIKYLTIDNQKLMYHPGLNNLINVGLTQPKLRIIKEPFFKRTFIKLINRILKKETKDKFEIDYDTKREDFLNSISNNTKEETKETLNITKENKKQIEEYINSNPSYLLDVKNPPIALSIQQFENLSKEEQLLFKEQNPNNIKTIDFFVKHGLNKNLKLSDIEKIVNGETSTVVNLKVKNQELKGKIRVNKNEKGDIKAVFHKQKSEPIEQHEVYKKLRSEAKKEHILTGGVLPIQTTNGTLKYYQYDKGLNDILEVRLIDLNIPKELLNFKSNNQVIEIFMGKPQKKDLEIEGIKIPNVDVVIAKGTIQIAGEVKGLVKEKKGELALTKEEIINEIVSNNKTSLDEKLKEAAEKKVALKDVLEAVEEKKSAPKKIKMVSEKIQNETKKALQKTLLDSNSMNDYLKKMSDNKNISVWIAFDENNKSISGISYKVDNEIILGKDSTVGLKELSEKFGNESMKQANIDKSFMVNRVEDKSQNESKKKTLKL